jgi:hypothetical protein
MKTPYTRHRYGGTLHIMLPLVFVVLVLTAGCGKPKGSISGKVIYKGKPLSGGFVTFILEKGAPLHAKIQSNGEYRIDNVPVGTVKITVQPESATGAEWMDKGGPPLPKSPDEMKKWMMPKTEAEIPERYSDAAKTELTYTVKQGPQEYDIVLK